MDAEQLEQPGGEPRLCLPRRRRPRVVLARACVPAPMLSLAVAAAEARAVGRQRRETIDRAQPVWCNAVLACDPSELGHLPQDVDLQTYLDERAAAGRPASADRKAKLMVCQGLAKGCQTIASRRVEREEALMTIEMTRAASPRITVTMDTGDCAPMASYRGDPESPADCAALAVAAARMFARREAARADRFGDPAIRGARIVMTRDLYYRAGMGDGVRAIAHYRGEPIPAGDVLVV